MIDSTTARPTSEITAAPSRPARVHEPTLITEQQVRFGTAAAVTRPPARTRRWTDMFASFASALRAAAGPPAPVARRNSGQLAYLQNALMQREMGRL
jgi:hypothetical protein